MQLYSFIYVVCLLMMIQGGGPVLERDERCFVDGGEMVTRKHLCAHTQSLSQASYFLGKIFSPKHRYPHFHSRVYHLHMAPTCTQFSSFKKTCTQFTAEEPGTGRGKLIEWGSESSQYSILCWVGAIAQYTSTQF